MGATVRVNVELRRKDKVEATCFDCSHRFSVTWQESRTRHILCAKCTGECSYDFYPDPRQSMSISYSSIIELGRLCGIATRANQYHGNFDPDVVLAHRTELRSHRFGATLLEIATAAKKARTDITWA